MEITQLPNKVKTIFKLKDVLRLNNLLTLALPELGNKPHYWTAYVLAKLQAEIRPYRQTIEKHADYNRYEDAIKSGKIEQQLESEFSVYLAFLREQKEIETELEIRAFPVEWLFKYDVTVTPLTAALYEYNLIDNIDKIAEFLYTEDKQNA